MPTPRPTMSVDDVRRFVRRLCFPVEAAKRVGAELEWLAFQGQSRAGLDRLEDALMGRELSAHSRITFEPGGQVELSSQPALTAGDACIALATDTHEIEGLLGSRDVSLVAAGMDPDHWPTRLLDAPRYRAMEEFFDAGGEDVPGAGRTMMCNTASIQVNVALDGPGGRDFRWRLAHAIGPVLAAAFANSPLVYGQPTGWKSSRLAAWHALDPSRTTPALGRVGCVEDWIEFVLDARVMLVRHGNDTTIHEKVTTPVTHRLSLRDWVEHGSPWGWPTDDDVRYHLTTLFPPVRAKGWLELRMIDALPAPWWRVAVAVAVALLDSPDAAHASAAAALRAQGRWQQAAHKGLADPILDEAARACFGIATRVLPHIGVDRLTIDAVEEFHDRFVSRGRCPADETLESRVPQRA